MQLTQLSEGEQERHQKAEENSDSHHHQDDFLRLQKNLVNTILRFRDPEIDSFQGVELRRAVLVILPKLIQDQGDPAEVQGRAPQEGLPEGGDVVRVDEVARQRGVQKAHDIEECRQREQGLSGLVDDKLT